MIFAQQVYQLAVFKIDRGRSKIVSTRNEVILSVLAILLIVIDLLYTTYRIIAYPEEGIIQSAEGKLIFSCIFLLPENYSNLIFTE